MTAALETAVAELEAAARRGRKPDAYLARPLLLALGEQLRADGAVAELLARAKTAAVALEPAWTRAVQDELTLAIGEFAQCLDPRFLDHPDYDMQYTQAARDRVADRLRAADALSVEVASRDSEVLALSDQVLAMALAKRG